MTIPAPIFFDDDDDDETLSAPPGPLGALPLSDAEIEALTAPGPDFEEPYEAAVTVLRREGEVDVDFPDDGSALPVANDEHLDVRSRQRPA
ncbi:MAG: hypothetical protein Q8O67_11305 [Deltaproteobacteria bacterium]|nr:hypothetical protein [Deltaproteobacteria bacterium]